MTSIPIDFTTQGSTHPIAGGIKCSCGKKATGDCNCERVHSSSLSLYFALSTTILMALGSR
jgi:hypothetical protein